MAATVSVSVETNGLGYVQIYSSTSTTMPYKEVHFFPSAGVTLDYTCHFKQTVRYNPQYGRDPEVFEWDTTFNGFTRQFDDPDCPLALYCAPGTGAWIASAHYEITITGFQLPFDHFVEPENHGRYIWFYLQWDYNKQNRTFHWNVKSTVDSYVFHYIRFYSGPETYDEMGVDKGSFHDNGTYVNAIAYFWKPTVTVTFIPNGGTVSPKQKTVVIGEQYGTLPTPVWQGHTFLGWYDANTTSARRIYSTSTVLIDTPHNLYARWEVIQVEVTITPFDLTSGKFLNFNTTEVGSYTALPPLDRTIPMGSGHKYVHKGDQGALAILNVHDNGTKYKLAYILKDGAPYDNTTYFYPTEDVDIIVYFRSHTYTYLPMYDAKSGKLLRGVKNKKLIRDGDA